MTTFGISCFHPTSFINRYTSELMSAPCGKCPACQIAKSSRATNNLDFVVKNSACAFFITLTYSTEYVPICSYRPFTDDYVGNFYKSSRYVNSYYARTKKNASKEKQIIYGEETLDLPSPSTLSVRDSMLLRQGAHNFDGSSLLPLDIDNLYSFPYLRRADLSAFIKRLRQSIFLKSDSYENLFYYACGEYGPSTLKPHFHIIVAFDTFFPFSTFVDCVNRSWKFGFVDVQYVKTTASSYVSGYLNGVHNLPSYLLSKDTCPFHTSSYTSLYFKRLPFEKFEEFFSRCSPTFVADTPKGFRISALPVSIKRFFFRKPFQWRFHSVSSLCTLFSDYQKPFIRCQINVEYKDHSFGYCFQDIKISDLSRLSTCYLSNGDPVLPSHYYTDYLWCRNVDYLASAYGLSIPDVITRIFNFYHSYTNKMLELSSQYNLQKFDYPCADRSDVLSTLFGYGDLFYSFHHCKAASEWPSYQIAALKLQGIYDLVFKSDGTYSDLVSEFTHSSFYQSFVTSINEDLFKKTKTKHLNDSYGLT